MTLHGIQFSAPMALALAAGTKNVTRRVLGTGNTLFNGRPWTGAMKALEWDWEGAWIDDGPSPAGNPGPYLKLPWKSGAPEVWEGTVHRIYPRVQPGDRLWVREAWRTPASWDDRSPSQIVRSCLDAGFAAPWCPIQWEADKTRTNWADWRDEQPGRLRAGIHLPRDLARIARTVTAVRIEHLHDITEADAEREGVVTWWAHGHTHLGALELPYATQRDFLISTYGSLRGAFEALWTELHGPQAWDLNPWVLAYDLAAAQ
jgi:hypothetical protein